MSTDEIVIEGLNESAMGPAVPVFAADTSNNMVTDEMSNEIDNGQAGRRVKITKHSISELRERLRRNPVTMGWGFKHALNANLSEHIKFREKEITLISGQTGSGKTSVTVQWALDFCMQGFRVGYFSQEIDVEHLLGNYIIPQLEILTGNSAEVTAQTEEQLDLFDFDNALMNSADVECWRIGLEEIIDRDQQKIIVLDNLQILVYSSFLIICDGSSSENRNRFRVGKSV